MNIISMETAHRIWLAHREIKVATELKAKIAKEVKEGRDPTPVDTWGRRGNFQLGVPNDSPGSRTLLDVPAALVPTILDAHVALQTNKLNEACLQAKMELESPAAAIEVKVVGEDQSEE